MRVFISIALIILVTVLSSAQTDTTYLSTDTLTGVSIVGKKSVISDTVDLTNHATTVHDYISLHSSFHIKDQGPAGLKTVTARGSSASQTKVVWQGLTINSAMNGNTDFTTLTLSPHQNITLHADDVNQIGGTIRLHTISPTSNSVTATFQQNSFDNTTLSYSLQTKNKKIVTASSLGIDKHQNDITFTNELLPDEPEVEVTHAQLNRRNIIQSIWYNHKKTAIDLHAWYNYTDRQLPERLFSALARATQQDENVRIALNGSYRLSPKLSLKSKSGFLSEYLAYQNPRISLSTQYNAYQYIQMLNAEYKPISNLKLSPSISTNKSTVNSFDHGGYRARWISDVGIKTTYFNSILSISTDLKQSHFDNEWLQPSISSNIKVPITKTLDIQALGAINTYNFPTLNDVFWRTLGDDNGSGIQPEKAKMAELSITQDQKIKKATYSVSVAGFYKWVDNWILWTPSTSNPGVFTPQNINTVEVKGVDIHVEGSIQISKDFSTRLAGNTTLQSILQKTTSNPENEGNQLPYTPQQTGNVLGAMQYKNWQLTGSISFTGKRYTSTDNKTSLKEYQLIGLGLHKSFKYKGNQLNTHFQVNNLLDEFYLNYENSIPLSRNYTLTIELDIK